MKKQFVILFALVLSTIGFAQQEIQSTQFMVSPFMLNPAYSSVEDDIDITLSYRNQWMGIEGAPDTYYIAMHSPVGKPRWARTHPGDFHNWHGVGGAILQDNIGAYRNTRVSANYSYNIGLKSGIAYGYEHRDGLRLALGAFAGWHTYRLDKDILGQTKVYKNGTADYSPTLNDPTYEGIPLTSASVFDVTFGLMFYNDDVYYIGISTTQLLENDVQLTEENSIARHYFISGKYKWQVSEDIYIVPSLITKYVYGAPLSFNFTTQLDWEDKVYAGLGYRTGDALTFMIGANLLWGSNIKNFKVSKSRYGAKMYYSYDLTMSKLAKIGMDERSSGTHEITMAFIIPPRFHERNAEDTKDWGGSGGKKHKRR